MFDTVRRLLDEAEKVGAIPEQPPFTVKPMPAGSSIVGVVPLEIRRLFVLARDRARELLRLAKKYEDALEIPASVMVRVRTLQSDIYLLEGNGEELIERIFFEETSGVGSLTIHKDWQVAWDPTDVEEECDCDEEAGEGGNEPDPDKSYLN